MPKEGKGVRFGGDEEEDEKTDLSNAKIYAFLNRKDTSAKDREKEKEEAQRKKETEFKKMIEESKNLDVSRLEKLAQINAILADFVDSEAWWDLVREFLEDVTSDSNTSSVLITLKREKGDHWVLDAEVG